MNKQLNVEDFKKELKQLLIKYNAEICIYTSWDNEIDIDLEISKKSYNLKSGYNFTELSSEDL